MKLDEHEQYWMDHYKCYDEQYGYNLCKEAAATKGRKPSEETRIKLKDVWKGRKHNDATKQKMVESAKLTWQNRKIKKSKILKYYLCQKK